MKIRIGARKSPLSQAQVEEVFQEICLHHPTLQFERVFLDSRGDLDQKTSLRELDKTDFFTREIDALLLSGGCRIAIHSAKDLPDPIPNGLNIVALTRGVDPSDSLVLREGETLESLPKAPLVATSSERREEMVRQLRADCRFIDIRGTIGQRLEKLSRREADGVVIAEAALIRLGLTRLNRVKLPGETVLYQGRLAILARAEDLEMAHLFSPIDARP